MIVDINKQTIKVTNADGKILLLPINVIDNLSWALSHDKNWVVMVIDASKASVDADNIVINDGAKCMNYSVEYLSGLANDGIGDAGR